MVPWWKRRVFFFFFFFFWGGGVFFFVKKRRTWGNADGKLTYPLVIGAEKAIGWADVEDVVDVAFENQLDE